MEQFFKTAFIFFRAASKTAPTNNRTLEVHFFFSKNAPLGFGLRVGF